MKTIHLLNGDCLADQFKKTSLNRNFIIFREALIVGNVNANHLIDFWKLRSSFISKMYQVTVEEYFRHTVNELEKVLKIPAQSEICLWFENDLFCQTNLWFLVSFLSYQKDLKLFRIFPVSENESAKWKGFENASIENLEKAYQLKIPFSAEDIELGKALWQAYQSHDLHELMGLSKTPTRCFENLEEICQAHVDRFPVGNFLGRPEKVLKEIMDTKTTDFPLVFSEFQKREGVYGFGDLQIRSMYDKLMKSNIGKGEK